MKATINGRRYDSEKCETLAEYDHRGNGNNYAGTSYLLRASDGAYLIHNDSNGQDCHFRHALFLADGYNATPQDFLENCDLDDGQEKRLVELGLLKVVD
jgi:hypothetical protein